jgi:hypothetical protein
LCLARWDNDKLARDRAATWNLDYLEKFDWGRLNEQVAEGEVDVEDLQRESERAERSRQWRADRAEATKSQEDLVRSELTLATKHLQMALSDYAPSHS